VGGGSTHRLSVASFRVPAISSTYLRVSIETVY
jgi:hypothetical protein